jgi:hypothetical protein
MSKKSLTPEEKLTVAYAHIVHGVKQHVLAMIYGVNSGRIAEAVIAVREGLGMVKPTSDEGDE